MSARPDPSVILQTLYGAFFNGDGAAQAETLRAKAGLDKAAFEALVRSLEAEGLIRAGMVGPGYTMTAKGVLRTEARGLIEPELAAQTSQLRSIILDGLVSAYDESGGTAGADLEALAGRTELDLNAILPSLLLLDEVDYVEFTAAGAYRPTARGLAAVREMRLRNEFLDELDRIADLRSPDREHGLQRLLGRAIEANGWTVEQKGLELAAHKPGAAYVIECGWEGGPSLSVLEEMAGQRGAAVLFGPKDVRALLEGQATFDKLVQEKRG